MTLVPVAITHLKPSNVPFDGDASKIQGSDWNDPHNIDPTLFLGTIGIIIVSGDPTGIANPGGPSGPRAIAWDQTNSQIWINTDGGTTWTALVRADGVSASFRRLFLIRTDSNGVGLGTESDQDDPNDNVTVPNNNIVFTKMFSTGFAEPITPTILQTGPLRVAGFSPSHGPELMIGAAINELLNGPGSTPDTAHKIWLDSIALSSSKLSDWVPGSPSGTASPLLGGSNLYTNSKNRALTASAVSGRQATCMFTMLGSNDASTPTDAANVLTNAPAFVAQNRADLGSQLLFVWVVIQTTIMNPPFTDTATVRANQIAALSAIPGVALVYADDIPTADDFAHFVSNGENWLGTRMAFAYIRLAGLRERVVTTPTVVGYSQASWNGTIHGLNGITGLPGANLRAFPWQGSADGDVMFLPVFSGQVGGSDIPTPSGWSVASTQVVSLDETTVTSRVALFTKNVNQSDLDNNLPSSGGPGFPTSFIITPGGNEFVVKPFTVRTSGRFPTITAISPFQHDHFNTSSVIVPGISAVAGQTIFLLTMCRGSSIQSISLTNPNLSNLTQVFGASYASLSGDFLYVGLWQGTLIATGLSGNSTLTPVINANLCGFTWAM